MKRTMARIPLRIAFRQSPPVYIDYKRDVKTGLLVYTGFRDPVHRLNLYRDVGFNFSIVMSDTNQHGYRFPNGSYFGFMSLLQTGKADHATPCIETNSLYPYDDLGYGPVSMETEHFICSQDYPAVRLEKEVLYSINTLDIYSCAMAMFCLFLVPMVLWLVKHYFLIECKKHSRILLIKLSALVSIAWGVALLNSSVSTTLLVLEKPRKIDTLQDIVDLKVETVFQRHSTLADDFKSGATPLHREVWRLATRNGTFDPFVEMQMLTERYRSGKPRPVIADLAHLDSTLASSYCTANEDQWKTDKTKVMLHGSPTFEKNNIVFLRLKQLPTIVVKKLNIIESAYLEQGIFLYIKTFNAYLDVAGKLPNDVADCARNVYNMDTEMDAPVKPLNVELLLSAFRAFAGCILLGGIILLIEWIVGTEILAKFTPVEPFET